LNRKRILYQIIQNLEALKAYLSGKGVTDPRGLAEALDDVRYLSDLEA
jgi:hypothetical protein